jgi:hypothetical protein
MRAGRWFGSRLQAIARRGRRGDEVVSVVMRGRPKTVADLEVERRAVRPSWPIGPQLSDKKECWAKNGEKNRNLDYKF